MRIGITRSSVLLRKSFLFYDRILIYVDTIIDDKTINISSL